MIQVRGRLASPISQKKARELRIICRREAELVSKNTKGSFKNLYSLSYRLVMSPLLPFIEGYEVPTIQLLAQQKTHCLDANVCDKVRANFNLRAPNLDSHKCRLVSEIIDNLFIYEHFRTIYKDHLLFGEDCWEIADNYSLDVKEVSKIIDYMDLLFGNIIRRVPR